MPAEPAEHVRADGAEPVARPGGPDAGGLSAAAPPAARSHGARSSPSASASSRAREARLPIRERELAEQRRVLAEQHRMLKSAAGPAAAGRRRRGAAYAAAVAPSRSPPAAAARRRGANRRPRLQHVVQRRATPRLLAAASSDTLFGNRAGAGGFAVSHVAFLRRRACVTHRPAHRARRRRRPRIRRPAAGRRVRARRLHHDRHRSRRTQGRRNQPGHVVHPGRADRGRRARSSPSGRLDATTDFAVVAELDTINICVPTPLRKTKDPDMSYIVVGGRDDRGAPAPGHAGHPRVDDLSGHDRGTRAADARGARPEGRASISSWRSRPSASIRATRRSTRTTCRRSSAASTPTSTRARRARSTAPRSRRIVPVELAAGRPRW